MYLNVTKIKTWNFRKSECLSYTITRIASKTIFSFVINCKQICTMVVSISIPTSNEWVYPLVHVLTIIWSCQCLGMRSSSIVLASRFNLQLHDIWGWASFQMLFFICISFLVRCIFRFFAKFLIGLFFWLSFKSSLHIWIPLIYHTHPLRILSSLSFYFL